VALAEQEDDGIRFRGSEGSAPLEVDFYLSVKEGAPEERGTARRFVPGEHLAVGQRVFFSVAASQAAILRLWVDGPGGREPIRTVEAGTELQNVGVGEQLDAYQFDGVGEYAFVASAQEGEGCEPPSCVTVRVHVGD